MLYTHSRYMLEVFVMTTIIQKWGNSLAVRIPRPLAKDSHISQGSEVEIALIDGQILVKPKSRSKVSLTRLLKNITPKNIHSEVYWRSPQGKEVW